MSPSDTIRPAAVSPHSLIPESGTSLTCKLDHMSRLDSTTNHLSWQNQASILLYGMDMYKYVDGSTAKAPDATQLAILTGNNYTATQES